VLGEDVEDERRAVDHLDLGPLLQVAQLRRRELAVADHRVGTGRLDHGAQLVDLAPADVGGGVGARAPLNQPFEHLGARCLGERGQLGERVFRVGDAAFGPDADQNHPLQPQLAVFDLGDVGELGRESGDPAQCVPIFQLQLTSRSLFAG
jgi:hypothetical protein